MENITEEPEPSPEVLPGEYFFTSENMENGRPAYVAKAVKLLIWSVALSAIRTFIRILNFNSPIGYGVISILIYIVVFALAIFFILKINEGMNWSRTIYTVLFAIGSVQFLFDITKIYNQFYLPTVLYLVVMGLQVYAMVLLYKKESNAWFKLKD